MTGTVSHIIEQLNSIQPPPYVGRHNWIAKEIFLSGWKAAIASARQIVQDAEKQ